MAAVIALLSCDHYIGFSEGTPYGYITDPDAYCKLCDAHAIIEKEWPYAWHTDCRNCTHVTHHRRSKAGAQRSANSHTKKTGHSVSVVWYSFAPPEAVAFVRKHYPAKPAKKIDESVAPPF
jgi:hypothetical protein